MDCNPDAPTHWLNQRMNAGWTTQLTTRHEDNPRYYDAKTNEWTQEGYEYVFGILGGLSGVRYARYRLGLWAAAEGTVYDWDRTRNVVDHGIIPAAWPRYMAIDFGFTHPFVCLRAAVDPDGRILVYRQLYKTKTLVENHAIQMAMLQKIAKERHGREASTLVELKPPLQRETGTAMGHGGCYCQLIFFP